MGFIRRALAALLACGLVVSCGGGGDGGSPIGPPPIAAQCGPAAEKDFVLSVARSWYLFLDLLPASVDLSRYATADELLDDLTATARAQHKDRFFSYLTSIKAEEQFFERGESVGFGIGIVLRDGGTRLFVSQVFEGSDAHAKGFVRGDEIVAIGTSAANMQTTVELLAQPDPAFALEQALGPSQAGVMRVLRVRTQAGQTVDRMVTKGEFSLDPVPDVILYTDRPAPVGYVNLRTFVEPAEDVLRQAFAAFRAEGIRNVIVDLRYNGGGLVATAEVLSNLLAFGRQNQVLFQVKLNELHVDEEETFFFGAEPAAIDPVRIAFLTTGSSASASELVINSLAPYADVAIIGEPTFGKPVGQFAFDLQGCDTRLRLVTFRTVNRDGHGDYYTGLPDEPFDLGGDTYCPAEDDLTQPQGGEQEEMTAEALHWIETGTCRTPSTGMAKASLPAGSRPLPPSRRPAPGEVYVTGLR